MKAKQDLFNYDGHFNTRSGIKFSLFEPKPEDIKISDIIHGLSYKGHFAGQTPKFFSIAQHSILVYKLLPEDWIKRNPKVGLAALLHDASEAYINDMIKPIKIHLPLFVEIENKIQKAIFDKYELDVRFLKLIKPFDKKAQLIEFDMFYNNIGTINYMSPEMSVEKFTEAYLYLRKLINTGYE